MGEGFADAKLLVILNSASDPIHERSGSLPGEILIGLGWIEQDGEDIIWIPFTDFDALFFHNAERFNGRIVEFLDGVVTSRGNMVIALVTHAIERLDHHIHQVADEDEIAPGVHHEAFLIVGEAVIESWQWAAQITGTIGICQAEGDKLQPAEADLVFSRCLADGITASIRADWVS